ncbi:MAG: tryptophan-rich sensory protein [Burkholderiales bacterium]|nr:tryptophan-rich sensory protein [Burkholderiales bacterium]
MNTDVQPALFANARRWLALLAWVGLCLSVGVVIGLFFKPGSWYDALEKPAFNPPAWLFAPVWTVLYVAMGVAAWRVWRLSKSLERTQALRQFGVQLILNAAWSPIFFGAQSLAGGLAVIVLMVFAIAATIQRFHTLDKPAAWLLAPYLAWVSFATLLNVTLLALNGKF